MWLFSKKAESPGPPVELSGKVPYSNADNAWKTLSIVIDWVRHADAKAAGTIAAAGVVGSALFNLVKDQRDVPLPLAILVVTCSVVAILGGSFAAWSLRPRLWNREKSSSLIYFSHISRSYKRRDGKGGYQAAFLALLANSEDLIHEIASQVWANAHIARQKYRWSNLGLMCVLVSLPLLAAAAIY